MIKFLSVKTINISTIMESSVLKFKKLSITMVSLAKNDRIKLAILLELKKEDGLTPSMLASKVKCKYETAKKALDFFTAIGLVRLESEKHGLKSYEYYKLTDTGKKVASNAV
ncbi:MAG: hypothetical protein WC506_05645 [Candidatus Micrarchaeia archaeon]